MPIISWIFKACHPFFYLQLFIIYIFNYNAILQLFEIIHQLLFLAGKLQHPDRNMYIKCVNVRTKNDRGVLRYLNLIQGKGRGCTIKTSFLYIRDPPKSTQGFSNLLYTLNIYFWFEFQINLRSTLTERGVLVCEIRINSENSYYSVSNIGLSVGLIHNIWYDD